MNEITTIGYEAASIDDFLVTLQAARIQKLIDVRAVSVSRKKGFSKNQLRLKLEAEGIQYLHLRDLGDPKEGRLAAKSGNYSKFFEIYSSHLNEARSQEALTRLLYEANQLRCCLMCYERDPTFCHRRLIANQLILNNILFKDLFVGERFSDERIGAIKSGHNFSQSASTTEQRTF